MNVNMNQENMNENLRILSEMSEEELNTVLAQVSSLVKKMAHNDGQLTEEDLEQVVGGIGILGITAGVAAVGAVAYLVANMFGRDADPNRQQARVYQKLHKDWENQSMKR